MSRHISPNTNKETQKRFYSTKNVLRQINKNVSKPDTTEAFKPLTDLQQTDITVCHKEENASNQSNITWM